MYSRLDQLRQQYRSSEHLILSFPRCGRTWMKLLLGHYISHRDGTPFTKRLEKKGILFRHDYMSSAGLIPWPALFKLMDEKKFYFHKEMKNQRIVYLFRNPLDVLFSYWAYLKANSYHNFDPTPIRKHEGIVDFAKENYWGLDRIINFMNMQLDHHDKNNNPKIAVKYERFKQDDLEWQRLIKFVLGDFQESSFVFAKQQTEFEKLQNAGIKHKDSDLNFFRKGKSDYVQELSKSDRELLTDWTGLAELNERLAQI